jgi:hypothetical protein
LTVVVTTEDNMVTKGGGNGTPSYKQVVVDRGKGPRGVGFKEPVTSTSGSGPEKNQESNQEKRDRMGEEARETQNDAQEPANPNGVEGRNPCKPKTTLIPKVILEDPQTQLFRDQMKMHALICKFMGLWPTERTLRNWIKYQWKPSGEVELHLGSKGFFTTVFMNLEDRDKVFEGGAYFHASAGLYMRPWKENFSPEKETFKNVPVWLRLYSLPLDYWLPSTFEAIGNKLGKYVKTSEATLKGRYTSYARICIEMDVSGALPEAISLEFRDEEWIQSIDYEQIPFRCRRCHEHGHLIRECPLNKKQEAENTKIQQDEDGFIKPNHRNRANKKPSKAPTGSNLEARTRTEGWDKTNKGEEGGKEKEKAKEAREQATNENTDSPSNKMEQGGSATPMDGETRDANTPMQEADGDVEMTPSEVGTEDPDLRDIVEREGIDLPNILEQWKRQGVDNVPAEQLDRIQYLFLLREEEKSRGLKCTHGEIGHLGIKAGEGQPQLSPKQTRRKKGRKSNNVALQELGALLINSGKIKNLFPNSPPHV